MNSTEIKENVKKSYTSIVKQKLSCCTGFSCGCSDNTKQIDQQLRKKYRTTDGYVSEADYGLGCGLPTNTAGIKTGDTVVDLGSGAGNDAFIARKIVGDSGRIIGIDMTEAMIEKARKNNSRMKYDNVEFIHAEIENIPLADRTADVVVSNCVLNLVPDKEKAFFEIYRILKPGGHFSISDIVIEGTLPEKFKTMMEVYAACIGGALSKDEYLSVISGFGFNDIKVMAEKEYTFDDNMLHQYLSEEDIALFRKSEAKILSITVNAEKEGSAQ